MALAEFIENNPSPIISEWETFARSLIPAASAMTPLALRNHIKDILSFVVEDMRKPQTKKEQVEKSHGEGKQTKEVRPSAAETHAALRLAGGFNLDQMVSEYRALRASIIKLWLASHKSVDGEGVQEMVRFNEAIDQAASESISHYAIKLSASKDLFLGILTHDLRNPLGAMLGAAELTAMIGPLTDKQKILNSQIQESGERIKEIISHLLDITKARFGSGLPVVRSEMDMGFVARQLVDEMRAHHFDRKFTLEVTGETQGEWDKARIGQVFSNLIGNAVQYGFKDLPIDVAVRGLPDHVIVSVHNQGPPIPDSQIGRIFDSLTRATHDEGEPEAGPTTNLGLGLYITREIVNAHSGNISVESSEKYGTTFTASFPREVENTKDEEYTLGNSGNDNLKAS